MKSYIYNIEIKNKICWCDCSSSNPACPLEPSVVSSSREGAAVQSVYGLSECYQLNCEERGER